jgi:elongation factor P
MSSIQATRMKRGMLIKMGNDLYRVLDLTHFTPGNKRGFVQARMRNIRSGQQADNKFRAEEDVERAILDERQMQYLYRDGDAFHFMDTSSYEQIHLDAEVLGDNASYIIPESVITMEFYEDKPVGIELPITVDLKVVDTTPAINRATASAQIKPATLETGLVVNVPPHVNIGDVIRVGTEDGEYQKKV